MELSEYQPGMMLVSRNKTECLLIVDSCQAICKSPTTATYALWVAAITVYDLNLRKTYYYEGLHAGSLENALASLSARLVQEYSILDSDEDPFDDELDDEP